MLKLLIYESLSHPWKIAQNAVVELLRSADKPPQDVSTAVIEAELTQRLHLRPIKVESS